MQEEENGTTQQKLGFYNKGKADSKTEKKEEILQAFLTREQRMSPDTHQ